MFDLLSPIVSSKWGGGICPPGHYLGGDYVQGGFCLGGIMSCGGGLCPGGTKSPLDNSHARTLRMLSVTGVTACLIRCRATVFFFCTTIVLHTVPYSVITLGQIWTR